MSDFYQTGVVATLHMLGKKGFEKIEKELNLFSRNIKTTLLIPVTASDYKAEPMKNILKELENVEFINQIVLSLNRAKEKDFIKVKEELKDYPRKVYVVWHESLRVQKLLSQLVNSGLKIGPQGKGRATWIGLGFIIAQGETDVLVLHDSDIITYSKEMLARLAYPVVSPYIDFEFSKGFYARFTDKLHGRVMRLLFTPLLRSLMEIIGYHPFLVYLDSFRYALAGEFAIKLGLARNIRIPGDWGLEIGMLAEVYRNVALKRICQVELADNYEHKHQALSPDDPRKGLHRMAIDIVVNLLRNLSSYGININEGLLRALRVTYLKASEDMIARYHADAMINGLFFDRHEEEMAVETFGNAIKIACEIYLEDPLGIPLIPNWIRISSAIPDFLPNLKKAVEEDFLEIK